MDLSALQHAAQPIPVHAVMALVGVAVGGVQFALPKGTGPHRALGAVWVAAMTVVAVSSFFITEFRWVGPFGPIHLLSMLVLVTLWRSVRFARRGAIAAHRSAMIQLYCYSLLLAGGFTLLPGRIMHTVVFG